MNLPGKSKLFASGAAALTIKVMGAALSYAMIVAFAHLLSAEEYGRFALGLNAAIIVSAVAGLGLATGILRYWPQRMAANDLPGARKTAEFGYMATLGAAILILVAAKTFVSVFPFITIETPSFIFAVSGLGGIVALGDYSSNLLRAQGSIITSMLPREVLWRILTPLLAFLLSRLIIGFNSVWSLAGAACVLASVTAWQGWHARKNLIAIAGSDRDSRVHVAIASSLLPLWAAGIIYAMIQQFDVVIVGSLLSKADAGSYFAAQKTAQLLSLVLIAGGLVTAPQMSALYHAGELAKLQALCRNLSLAIAVVTSIGFLFLVAAGKVLLGLFDPGFAAAYPILIVLALGATIDAICGANAYLMQMTRFEGTYLKILVCCYAFVIAAQFFLIPRYGSMGAALASAGGVVLWNALAICILRAKAGIDPSLLSFFAPPRQKAAS